MQTNDSCVIKDIVTFDNLMLVLQGVSKDVPSLQLENIREVNERAKLATTSS